MTTRSNLLVIFGDQHRGEGARLRRQPRRADAPRSTAWRPRGCDFTHAYANTPVCTPSRGSLLTGQWPHRHRALSNDLPLNVGPHTPAIARSLRAAAYRCGYIGKWHIGGWPRDRFIPPGPERLGFDDFWAAWSCRPPLLRAALPPERLRRRRRAPPAATNRRCRLDLALSWLGDHLASHDEQPFCLFPVLRPAARSLLAGAPPVSPTATGRKTYACAPTARTPRRSGTTSPATTRISPPLDTQIERLLSFLRDSGVLDDTLVVFTSDHGDMLGSHGRRNKQCRGKSRSISPLLLRFGNRLPQGTTDDLLIGLVGRRPDHPRPARHTRAGGDAGHQPLGANSRRRRRATVLGLSAEAITCDQAVKVGVAAWRGVADGTLYLCP